MLDQKTKQHINNARNVLVGKVPDPKAQVEQITTALIYKFMDDMDKENEELGGKIQFFTENLKGFSWSKLMSRELSGDERWNIYTRALEAFAKAEQIPELFRTIFKGAFLPYRDPQTLNLFLKEINEFKYDHSENLGNAFEYLLSILGSQGDAGQFRTPRHIIDFIVEVVAPQKDETILDPACGTAGFLISSYKHIKKINSSNYNPKTDIPSFAQTENKDITDLEIQSNGKYNGDKLKPADKIKLAKNIAGYDISPDMVRLSLVNMYLHGFVTPKIQEYDTLTYEDKWDEDFDVILANPPFMTPKGGIRPHKRFQVQANRAEVLFVDYIAEHLKINGRAGIIVPEGIIFQSSNAYKSLRKMLVDNNLLFAVVSLPAGVFQPYSGVKTSVLFLDKQLAKKSDEILFVKVENDGFDLGAQRRKIEKNDLPKAYEILYHEKHETHETFKEILKKYPNALLVKKNKIAENGDYNLTGDRYKEAIDYSNVKWPMVRLGEVLDYEQPTKYIVESTNYKTEYKTPVLTAGKSFILGYTNETEGIFLSENLPVIIFDDFTTATKFVDFPFKVKSSAMKILLAKNKNVNIRFIFNMIQNIKFTPTQHKRFWISKYSKIEIPLPPLEIQKGIVAEIEGYQKIIDGARQVVENWKPQIKINPDWPMVKLGEICKFVRGPFGGSLKKEIFKKEGYLVYEQYHAINNDFSFARYFIDKDKFKEMKRFEVFAGDLLMSCSGTMGKIALVPNEFKKGIINQALLKLTTNKNINKYFLKLLLESNIIQSSHIQNAAGAGIKNVASVKILKEVKVPLPALEVQEQIVSEIEKEQEMINSFKKLIEIHEKKIKDKIAEVWGKI